MRYIMTSDNDICPITERLDAFDRLDEQCNHYAGMGSIHKRTVTDDAITCECGEAVTIALTAAAWNDIHSEG